MALADYCPYIQVSVQNTRPFLYLHNYLFVYSKESACTLEYTGLVSAFKIFPFMHLKYIHSSFLIIFETLCLQLYYLCFSNCTCNQRSSLGGATMWWCGAVTACMKRTNQVSHNTFLVVVVVLFVVVVVDVVALDDIMMK